jgi:ech hydrogenase subunit D
MDLHAERSAMSEAQLNIPITLETLVGKTTELRQQGYRLAQIGATPLGDTSELNYTFDREGEMINLRLVLQPGHTRIPSISPIYWCAFIYENELHDLFHLQVDGLVLDFQGQFYKTRVPFPFAAQPNPGPAVTKVAPPAVPPAPPVTQPLPVQS